MYVTQPYKATHPPSPNIPTSTYRPNELSNTRERVHPRATWANVVYLGPRRDFELMIDFERPTTNPLFEDYMYGYGHPYVPQGG